MITVILTGGASRRMGTDKAMLPLNGMTMALALAKKYESLGQVVFSVDRKGRFPIGEYREMADRFPGCGPLNGLVSVFQETEEELAFLTATDMPAGSLDAVKILLDALGEHDACLFRGEPLFGVYRRNCLPAALECLQEGERSMRGFLCRVDALELTPPGGEELVNLNTPEEFHQYIGKRQKSL